MILMHKNDPVAKIILHNGKPMGVSEIINSELLPIGLNGSLDFTDSFLSSWNARRAIPIGRIGSEELFQRFGSPETLTVKSFGLSLTDCYWYKKEDHNINWEDVNIYDNSFIPDMHLFINHMLNDIHISPDYTTDGMLQKFWTNISGAPALIKSGEFPGVTNGSGILAVNEVVAKQIADLMEIKHAEYKIVTVEKLPDKFCASKCIIPDSSNEFISGSSLKDQFCSLYDQDAAIENILNNMGYSQFVKNIKKFDFLIGNHDRHLSNFGLLQDSSTMEILGPAPLFDSGSSLGWNGDIADFFKPFNKNREQIASELISEEFPEKENILAIIKDIYEKNNVLEKHFEIAKKTITEGFELIGKEKSKDQIYLAKGIEEITDI